MQHIHNTRPTPNWPNVQSTNSWANIMKGSTQLWLNLIRHNLFKTTITNLERKKPSMMNSNIPKLDQETCLNLYQNRLPNGVCRQTINGFSVKPIFDTHFELLSARCNLTYCELDVVAFRKTKLDFLKDPLIDLTNQMFLTGEFPTCEKMD